MNKLCIDIGGSNIRVVIYNQKGSIIIDRKITTEPNNFMVNFENIAKIIQEYQIDIAAIGMPGPADYVTGILLDPPNLPGWKGCNVKREINKICHPQKIFLENDAKLMALANHQACQGTKKDITQFFTISTGIGAGLIINNQIFNGSNNHAQEIAHLPINSSQEKNHLSPGALEYFASGSGILTRAKKYGFFSTQEVFAAYQDNPQVRKIIDQGISALAHAIAASVAFVNPNKIIFDGSLARHQKWYVEAAVKEARQKMYQQQSDDFEIFISSLGDKAVIAGCLTLINQNINED